MHRGDRIAALREARHLTQEQLAQILEISRASLSHYEKNRRAPDYETLTKMAEFFDVSVDYLVGRTDQPSSALDEDIKQFIDSLELSDQRLLEKFTLTVDGRKLTKEEAQRFIAFIRAIRSTEQQ